MKEKIMDVKTILIVDDDKNILSLYIQFLNFLKNEEFKIVTAISVESGIEAILTHKPEIVILDVELEDGFGFDILKKLPSYNFTIIFITAHDKYALNAIKFSAFDYLLKPVDPVEFVDVISKAIVKNDIKFNEVQIKVLLDNYLESRNTIKKIVLKDFENTFFVKIDNILYCKAEGNYTVFYLEDNSEIMVSKILKEYEFILEPFGFIRSHHSYLINADKITMYNKSDGGHLIINEKHKIPVSQRRKDTVTKALKLK